MPDVYVAWGLNMVKAESKNYLSVLNTNTAGKTIDIIGARISQSKTNSVVGQSRGFRLYRITAHSLGSQITPEKIDTNSPDLLTDVATLRGDGQSVTLSLTGGPLGIADVGEDETGAAGGNPGWLYLESELGTLVCRRDEGVAIQQEDTVGSGRVSAVIYFRVNP